MAGELLHPHSLWSASVDMPVYPPLSANIDAEVCVVAGSPVLPASSIDNAGIARRRSRDSLPTQR